MNNSSISFHVLNGFDDPIINKISWNELLINGSGNFIFMTHEWQRVWWEIFGRGKLILIAALRNEKPIAIAPLFADEGMIYFIGSGGSDYLDFIGNIEETGVLEGMLDLARHQVPGLLGFRFYHVPETSNTKNLLERISQKIEWEFYDEGEWPIPVLEMKIFPEQAQQAVRKKSLLRHETWFAKNGSLKVEHFNGGENTLAYLPEFFEQHINRWGATPFPSLFLQSQQKQFYKRLCEELSSTGWLRFTRLAWKEYSIAFHFGLNFCGRFLWYKPSFDITLAKHSPGEVLLRQLLLLSINEQVNIFDFGLGDEAFKKRFATNTQYVKTWGIYPKLKVKS